MPGPIVSEGEKWEGVPSYLWAQTVRALQVLGVALLLALLSFVCGAYWAWTVWGAGHSWGG